MSHPTLKPPRKCVPADPPRWLADTLAEVSAWVRTLRIAGWTMTRIAVSLGCSEDSLRDWRDGKTSMPVVKWKALRALAAEVAARKVGT
jgi:hypothetical protein